MSSRKETISFWPKKPLLVAEVWKNMEYPGFFSLFLNYICSIFLSCTSLVDEYTDCLRKPKLLYVTEAASVSIW